jgi:hypothetical protein
MLFYLTERLQTTYNPIKTHLPLSIPLIPLTPDVARLVRELRTRNAAVETGWGRGKPVVSALHNDQRVVVIRNRVYYLRKEATVPDFIDQFMREILGRTWGDEELRKPFESRHPLFSWFPSMAEHISRQMAKNSDQGYTDIPLSSATAAYFHLAYDVLTVANEGLLTDLVIRRLRLKDQFQGARNELFVTALFVRAGFSVALENESSRRTKHHEFVATHAGSRESFAVEAKSRHRSGILGQAGNAPADEEIRLEIGHLLSGALSKPTSLRRFVFIEANMPTVDGDERVDWFEQLRRVVQSKEFQQLGDGSRLPPCYLFVTNNPYHYGDPSALAAKRRFVATGFRMADFHGFELDYAKQHHSAYCDLLGAAELFIPNDFPVVE